MSTAVPESSNAWTLKDWQSRYELQTRTRTGEYDQVVAISQDSVNATLANLFTLYEEEMATMYDSSPSFGRIDAVLKPSTIMIPAGVYGSNTTQVLYQLRFQSGSVYLPDGRLKIEDLADFVISFRVDLLQFSDDPAKKPKSMNTFEYNTQTELNKSLRESLKKPDGSELPGDYSIERLYAKLSSADFGSPDMEQSFAGRDPATGELLPWSEWSKRNFDACELLGLWIKKWATEQDRNGRNVFGYNVQLRPGEKAKLATYESRDLVYQTYAYKQKDDCPNGETKIDGYGGRNCLLYCEMTQASVAYSEETKTTRILRDRPADLGLVWSGNFTTYSSTVGNQINGSFLLNREVILGAFLLPNFCKLNQATDICHLLPTAELNNETKQLSAFTPYTSSFDQRFPNSTDPVYAFTNNNPLNDARLPMSFSWKKVNKQPVKDEWIYFPTQIPGSSNLRIQCTDEMSTTVTWQPGDTFLLIKGNVKMDVKMQWDSGLNGETDWSVSKLWAYSMTKWKGEWVVRVSFQTRTGPNGNGVMDIVIDAGKDNDGGFDLKVDGEVERRNIITPDYSAEIRESINKRFREVVPAMTMDIRDKLQGTGAFTFPGSGVFSFRDPRLTRWGDIVTQIDYLPLEPGRMVIIPRQSKPTNPPDPPQEVQKPISSAKPGQFALTWTRTPLPEDKITANTRGSIVWRGTNNRDELVTFAEIRITFSSCNRANHLFREKEFFLDGKQPQPETPASENSTSSGLKVAGEGHSTGTTKGDDWVTVDAPSGNKTPQASNTRGEVPSTAQANEPTSKVGPVSEVKQQQQTPVASHQPETKDTTGAPVNTTSPTAAKSQSIVGTVVDKISETYHSIVDNTSKPKTTYGLVRFRQQMKSQTGVVRLICQNPDSPLVVKWQVTLDDTSDVLRLMPGEWVEMELIGLLGDVKSYGMIIEEQYELPGAKKGDGQRKEEKFVVLAV